MRDLESRIAASLHRAADRDDLPESDLADVFARTRQRRNARRVIGATDGVVLLTAGVLMFVCRDDSSSRRINTGTTQLTVVPGDHAARPVLDDCTTMSEMEAVGGAGW